MDEILINTDTAGVQDQPAVAGFRGTQFAVVWADHATGDIKGQMLGVNAAPSDNVHRQLSRNAGDQASAARRYSKPARALLSHGPSNRRGLRDSGAGQASHLRRGYAVGT